MKVTLIKHALSSLRDIESFLLNQRRAKRSITSREHNRAPVKLNRVVIVKDG